MAFSPPMFAPIALAESYSCLSCAPAQKYFSNSSASSSAALIVFILIKIYFHENNDARINISITICTGILAPMIRDKKDKSPFTFIIYTPLKILFLPEYGPVLMFLHSPLLLQPML